MVYQLFIQKQIDQRHFGVNAFKKMSCDISSVEKDGKKININEGC
jgi:hypothetical protein